MFEVTLITESANHKCYRVSLRSSSKQTPSNPSPNRVRETIWEIVREDRGKGVWYGGKGTGLNSVGSLWGSPPAMLAPPAKARE
jgi:hypothetical protein